MDDGYPMHRQAMKQNPCLPFSFIVHDLHQARAALTAAAAADVRVTLRSPPGAAHYQGIGYFAALIEAGKAEVPSVTFDAVLDCGESAGLALAALRTGIKTIALTGHPDIVARVADIAAQVGARIETAAPSAPFDLGRGSDPLEAARAYLAGATAE